jgi:hypothetical protein
MTETEEEVDSLVDGVIENPRREIVEQQDQLIERVRSHLDTLREADVFISELRRRMRQ